MTLSRRHFLLGAGAGLILPEFFDKAWAFVETRGEPLLVAPKTAEITLNACDREWDGESFDLCWGDPWAQPPEMTIREITEREGISLEEWTGVSDEELWGDVDSPADWETICSHWGRTDSPSARAYYLLSDMDLGPKLRRPNTEGEIRFLDSPTIGSDYLGVEAVGMVSLSLLQQRLNEIDSRISINVCR